MSAPRPGEPPVDRLADDVADLACRIHHSRPQVVPFADVTFRLQQAGYAVTIDQVKDAVVHRESGP